MPRPGVDLEEPVPRSSNTERRASVRHRAADDLTCPVATYEAADAWSAVVRDVSTLGIGLTMDRRVTAGALLQVGLRRANGVHVRDVLARVVHADEEAAGVWQVGCAFVVELARDELALFHADAVRSAGPDSRRWVRYPCDVETVCTTCEMLPGERHRARVLNVSAGGVGLLLACQFPTGTLLHFALPPVLNQPARSRYVRVARVQPHERGSWFLGCEFVDELAADDLHDLLRP